MMKLRKFFIMFFVLIFLVSCAGYTVQNKEQYLKLKIDSLSRWYFSTYVNITSYLNDPLYPKENKEYLMKEVNPLMNTFKKVLVDAIDAYSSKNYQLAEALIYNLEIYRTDIIAKLAKKSLDDIGKNL